MSQLKIKNGNTWEAIPAGGVGVPSGGSSGQFLKKSSSTDYATEWDDIPIPLVSGAVIQSVAMTEVLCELKKLDDVCFFTFSGKMTNAAGTTWKKLLEMPEGFRTSRDVLFTGYVDANRATYSISPGTQSQGYNGIYCATNWSAGNTLSFSITYICDS